MKPEKYLYYKGICAVSIRGAEFSLSMNIYRKLKFTKIEFKDVKTRIFQNLLYINFKALGGSFNNNINLN